MALLQIFRISITGRLNLLMITIPIIIEGLEDSTREMVTFSTTIYIVPELPRYNTVKSGMSDYLIKFNFRRPSIFEAVTWGNPREEINPVTPVDDPGKQLRTNINRIRCVYRAN